MKYSWQPLEVVVNPKSASRSCVEFSNSFELLHIVFDLFQLEECFVSQQVEERGASAFAKENENLMKVVNSRRISLPVSFVTLYMCVLTELQVVGSG